MLAQFTRQWRGGLNRAECGSCALWMNDDGGGFNALPLKHKLSRNAVLSGSTPKDHTLPPFLYSAFLPLLTRPGPPPHLIRRWRFGHESGAKDGSELFAVGFQFPKIPGKRFLPALAGPSHEVLRKLFHVERLAGHLPPAEYE